MALITHFRHVEFPLHIYLAQLHLEFQYPGIAGNTKTFSIEVKEVHVGVTDFSVKYFVSDCPHGPFKTQRCIASSRFRIEVAIWGWQTAYSNDVVLPGLRCIFYF